MPNKINVLYIDDETDNLVGFKASLRLDYQVFTASTVPEALTHLENNPEIRVVFCDQRMPGITGVDFFEQICVSHPLPVRILLTAYTDVGSLIDAINKGNIFRYVTKPWNEAEIISAIEEASKFYMANSMLTIKNDELQKAYNELNKFAYSVSHDIRGPISGILGAIDVARSIDDMSEVKEMLYLMEKSLKKLDAYIISMHDYYNLQRGELHIAEIDFNKVMDEMKEIYNVFSKVKDVRFTAAVKQNEVFRGDVVPIKLILNNLLSNAFKYQNKNNLHKSVDVSIEVENRILTMFVKDTGIGILGTHVGEIFNLFYRANSQESGSGFGLYNVKGALLKLNGQIEVSSVMHKGTMFKVSIPSV